MHLMRAVNKINSHEEITDIHSNQWIECDLSNAFKYFNWEMSLSSFIVSASF